MQGFILETKAMKNEDLLVFILTKNSLVKAYRFYGLRHSVLLTGVKIDFALEENPSFLPRLKDVLGLSYSYDRDIMIYWQNFMHLMYLHLKISEELDEFYFNLVEKSYERMKRQDPKRVMIDAYIKLLEHEGRLDDSLVCFACDKYINDPKIALIRGFLAGHTSCVLSFNFEKEVILQMFKLHKSSAFDDEDINKLYTLLNEGF